MASDTQFTRGPWKRSRVSAKEYIASVADHGQTVARVVDYVAEFRAEQIANANLIAAAPELFEALTAAKFWIGMQDHQSAELSLVIDCALAKALGEQVSA